MIIKNYVCVDSFIPNLLREKKMLSDLILTDLFFFFWSFLLQVSLEIISFAYGIEVWCHFSFLSFILNCFHHCIKDDACISPCVLLLLLQILKR